ncbi:hypothetical protein AMEX_G1255 [Astyanax mexicanus]|uniref:NSL1 component of MIS12 kinetochore complex n=2 Tax=Astyanax mexicanus TaxID=7994 RepID=A0A8B9JTD4_ASTMX|nr:hypothetical protein AMEX_G1255 [Astyanax mexicanus]
MEGRVSVPDPEKEPDPRVSVSSRRRVTEQIARYQELLKTLLEKQPELSEQNRDKLSQEALRNFELVVQENIVVDGLPWEEAAEEDGADCEVSTLDDMLDEKIVEATRKRSIYPKKILPYVVRSLKAERKLMGLLENTIVPQEIKRDPAQDAIMNNVSAAAPGMFGQASTVIKSLKALKQTAEGLYQVMNMQPSDETLDVYREIFGSSNGEACPVLCNRGPASKQAIKRAVSETVYSLDYVPMMKTPTLAKKD